MTEPIIVEILLGLIVASVAFATFIMASRANKLQSKAVVVTVDAEAYTRARDIYEGVLNNLRSDIKDLRDSNKELKESNERMRLELIAVHESNNQMVDEIDQLRHEINVLRNQ